MSDVSSLAKRIDNLETRIAYQDDTIETLNTTITAQWKQIESLTGQIAMLSERVQSIEANAPSAPANETPPHY
jgi:SlyX protein